MIISDKKGKAYLIKIKANKKVLFSEFEFSSENFTFYLDIHTGRSVFVSDLDEMEDKEIIQNFIEDNPDRFIEFPLQNSTCGFNDMLDFANSIENKKLQNRLYAVLDGQHPFRRFKDVLLEYSQERQEWFSFEKKRKMLRFDEWLQYNNIEIIEI